MLSMPLLLNNLRTNALKRLSFSCLQCREIKIQEKKCTNPFMKDFLSFHMQTTIAIGRIKSKCIMHAHITLEHEQNPTV